MLQPPIEYCWVHLGSLGVLSGLEGFVTISVNGSTVAWYIGTGRNSREINGHDK